MFVGLTTKIPNHCYVACSGGADSMMALHFAHNHGKRSVVALHVVHAMKGKNNSEFRENAFKVMSDYAFSLGIPVRVEFAEIDKVKKSTESDWSDLRRKIYNSIQEPVVVAHNLDDAMEWWMMRAIRGKIPNLIPTTSGNVIRPFLMWSKSDIMEYVKKNNIPYVDDPTNFDESNLRGSVRKKLISTVDELGDLRSILKKQYDGIAE